MESAWREGCVSVWSSCFSFSFFFFFHFSPLFFFLFFSSFFFFLFILSFFLFFSSSSFFSFFFFLFFFFFLLLLSFLKISFLNSHTIQVSKIVGKMSWKKASGSYGLLKPIDYSKLEQPHYFNKKTRKKYSCYWELILKPNQQQFLPKIYHQLWSKKF